MKSEFLDISEKVLNGEPLSFEDGVVLFNHRDLLAVGQLANVAAERLHGNVTYYNFNLHLNVTNVCEADCIFCSFARLEMGMPQAYVMTIADALDWIQNRYRPGMTEIHIVNGLNPSLPFSYYADLVASIREKFPSLHIKAFTAVEIHYFSKKFNLSYEDVLIRLMESGVKSLPGGGAEIFSERVRNKLCRGKATGDEWLEVHRVAHSLGLKSNCTMLYGTIETVEERVEHLLKLRELQERTGGFQAFVPLAFHAENNRLGKLKEPSAADDLRVMAVSRLMLHNIPHVKAYWVMLGIKTAQIGLLFGANDLDGTVTEEKVYRMAGAKSPGSQSVEELNELIGSVGRVAVERNSLYEAVTCQE